MGDFTFVFGTVLDIWYVLYAYSMSELGLASLQVFVATCGQRLL